MDAGLPVRCCLGVLSSCAPLWGRGSVAPRSLASTAGTSAQGVGVLPADGTVSVSCFRLIGLCRGVTTLVRWWGPCSAPCGPSLDRRTPRGGCGGTGRSSWWSWCGPRRRRCSATTWRRARWCSSPRSRSRDPSCGGAPTNTGFQFRPEPTGIAPDFSTVDHEIMVIPYASGRHELIDSSDAGRTWRTVDLTGAGWNFDLVAAPAQRPLRRSSDGLTSSTVARQR